MSHSFLYRYEVTTVPLILKPVFYLYSYVVAGILLAYAVLVHSTSKIEITGRERLQGRSNFLFCHWHTFIPLYFCTFLYNRRQVWMQHPFWFMKPVHLFLRFIGIERIILGSTGHHGQEAADELVTCLREGCSTVLLPDGPSGPPFVLKKGILHISLQSNVPIVPMQFQVSRFFEANTWDRKKMPLPFTSISLQFGMPVQVSRGNFDKASAAIEKALG